MSAILGPRRSPSIGSEIRRGFSAGNLAAAVSAALAFSLVAGALSTVPIAIATGAAAFAAITALHVGLHAYFGWRFGRGMEALATGDERRARRLLRVVQLRGLEHYDPEGIVREAVASLASRGGPAL